MMWDWFGIGFSLTIGVCTALLIATVIVIVGMLIISILLVLYEYLKGKQKYGNRL